MVVGGEAGYSPLLFSAHGPYTSFSSPWGRAPHKGSRKNGSIEVAGIDTHSVIHHTAQSTVVPIVPAQARD